MDIKLLLSILATITGVIAFLTNIKDIFHGTTQPHIYTWIIWLITQGIAVAGLLVGGGGIGALSLTVGVVFIALVFLLTFRRGTKNITRSDTITLIVGLCAIGVWVFLKAPIPAVILASAIDVSGYIPSIRKSYKEPWSENVPSWGWWIVSNFFALAALHSYNFLTVTYILSINTANAILLLVCLARRPKVPISSVVKQS